MIKHMPTLDSPGFKPQLFEQFARIGQALASGPRLEMIELLIQAPRSVDALAKALRLPVANVSQHLQQLKSAGLVSSVREGRCIIYNVSGEDVIELLLLLQRIAHDRFAEIDRLVEAYLNSRDELEPLSVEEVLRLTRRGALVILDVRPEVEFRHGHLKGALHVSLEELEERLEDLPRDKAIVAYCRGSYCVLSYDAVALLRSKGFEARRVENGIPNWVVGQVPLKQTT